MYFAFAVIYVVLVLVFIADVAATTATALSGVGKALWIVALLLVPVLPWIVYGFWRMDRAARV